MPPTPSTRSTRYLPARTSPSRTPAAELEPPCVTLLAPFAHARPRKRAPSLHFTRSGGQPSRPWSAASLQPASLEALQECLGVRRPHRALELALADLGAAVFERVVAVRLGLLPRALRVDLCGRGVGGLLRDDQRRVTVEQLIALRRACLRLARRQSPKQSPSRQKTPRSRRPHYLRHASSPCGLLAARTHERVLSVTCRPSHDLISSPSCARTSRSRFSIDGESARLISLICSSTDLFTMSWQSPSVARRPQAAARGADNAKKRTTWRMRTRSTFLPARGRMVNSNPVTSHRRAPLPPKPPAREGDASSTRVASPTPEDLLQKATAARSSAARARYARRGLAARHALDR